MKIQLSDVLPRDLIDLFRSYADVIKSASSEFAKAITLLNDMRVGEARALLSKVVKLLDKSGEYKTVIEEGVAKTSIDPGLKEEILTLVNMYDEIGDAIKEASRELTILPFLELPDRVRRGLVELARVASRSVSLLSESLVSFVVGEYEKVEESFKEVLELEERADEIEAENRGLVLEFGDSIRPYTLQLLVYSLNNALELVTDLVARVLSRTRLIIKAWLS
ncbi:MAG: DUF47 family protein [Desulfurococcaceae archaeon]|nr:DUF47 family protein [Desulfurococcaceae archaeon]